MADLGAVNGALDRYRRVVAGIAALSELADGPDGAGLTALLTGDEVALARLRAAAAVLRPVALPAGLTSPDELEDCTQAELLDAAIRWQHYARDAVEELHRACAGDIARGLLRLWAGRQEPETRRHHDPRVRLRQARIALLGRVRSRCAALRAELHDDTAALNRRRVRGFPDYVARRVAEVTAELVEELEWELPGGAPESASPVVPPPPHRAGPEAALTGLFGAAFGIGVALTLGRALPLLVPGWSGVVLGIAVGAGLGGWVVVTRRLLARRVVLDRWVSEVTAGLRAELEERIALRMLAAEAAGRGKRTDAAPG